MECLVVDLQIISISDLFLLAPDFSFARCLLNKLAAKIFKSHMNNTHSLISIRRLIKISFFVLNWKIFFIPNFNSFHELFAHFYVYWYATWNDYTFQKKVNYFKIINNSSPSKKMPIKLFLLRIEWVFPRVRVRTKDLHSNFIDWCSLSVSVGSYSHNINLDLKHNSQHFC